MARPEFFLPKSYLAKDLFHEVNRWHRSFTQGDKASELQEGLADTIALDYLKAATAFLMRTEDDRLYLLGKNTWQLVYKDFVSIRLHDNVDEEAKKHGITPPENPVSYLPYILYYEKNALFLTPTDLIILSKKNPIKSLLVYTHCISSLYDFRNGKHLEQESLERSYAHQSHVLRYIIHNMEQQIDCDNYMHMLLRDYPRGYWGLDEEIRYPRISLHGESSAKLN